MKRILLTGKDGQVGWELQRTLATLGSVWAFNRQELDLQDHEALRNAIREIKPDLIVNAAAYTAVDKAETEQEAAYAINAIAPAVMAEEAKKCGAIFVHYSTDYVFDGAATSPYVENDPTSPLSIYGKTKLEGELAVQALSGKYLILRTSWVYGTRGKNFLLTMLRLGKEKESLKIVGDQLGAPTWSRLIASMTAQMTGIAWNCQDRRDIWGTYHLTSAGQTSWYGFADEIFNIHHASGISIPKLHEITASEYPLPAIRPSYSVLSNDKLARVFGLKMPDWKEGLHLCLDNGMKR
jgi:dTDP-4-dehydrorhamnose reductase